MSSKAPKAPDPTDQEGKAKKSDVGDDLNPAMYPDLTTPRGRYKAVRFRVYGVQLHPSTADLECFAVSGLLT